MTELETLRAALEAARETIVLGIAFLGRDLGTERMERTVPDLIADLVKADGIIRDALRASSAPPHPR